uniref:Retrotransposon protein, putative, Ty1-copia subclass n=1 Tax=Tanacetum cinerariifolium TaxID=118510 RepID=A0A6L2JMF5_TANCI|nr:retrotransposon protein, putative, Ty1-copia subclass [Tanacetum cinerariifolium]
MLSCVSGKMAHKPFPHKMKRAKDLLGLIHTDDYALESVACIFNMVLTKKVKKTPYELWHGKVPNLSYLKVWVKNLISQEARESHEDLEIIQNEDTHPSENTSNHHDEVEHDNVEPQSEVTPFRSSEMTHRAPNWLCLYMDSEDHGLGDHGELLTIKLEISLIHKLVTSDNESESDKPDKDDSSVFTTFPNLLFNDKDDVTIHEDDVPIKEFKVYSNPLFDNDEINYDELESNIESNSVESLSNHDTKKFDHLEEFFGPIIPVHITEEERIRREHADYISRIEILFTINPRPYPTMNANTNVKSIPSSFIPVQDNDSQREEIDIVTNMDVLPPGFENDDDSNGEVNAVNDLRVNNSISNSEHELSDNEESNFDNLSVP